MKKVIYYFSDTGNSLNAARMIAEEMGGAELISVKQNAEEVPASDAKIIGFVCPVYEWDIPERMKQFIRKLEVNPKAYFFMAATYIAIHGRCFETVDRLLRKKGARLHYGKAIRCVASQCIAYEPFPPQKIMLPYSRKMTEKAAKEIARRTVNRYPRMSPVTRKLYPKMMTPFIEIEREYDKGFYTSDSCTGCGLCSKVCSCRNITIENKRPVFHHKCIGCNSCVVYCPNKAIQFKTPEAYIKLDNVITRKLKLPDSRTRYHHPDISARDMISKGETVPPRQKQEEN